MGKLNGSDILSVSTAQLGGGQVWVFDFGDFKLHTFVTGDPMGDMSNIIEGENSVVIVEYAAFHKDIAAQKRYIKHIGKPIEKAIADYHLAGLEDFSQSQLILVDKMPEFAKSSAYSKMLKSFAHIFDGAMNTNPLKKDAGTTVQMGSVKTFAGVRFEFSAGAANDFPGAAIVIGGKVRYTHWAPIKAHCTPMQIGNRAAIDAVLSDLHEAKMSGCVLFTGGHGIGVARMDAVEFQIAYFEKAKELLGICANAAQFIAAMDATYPQLPEKNNLIGFAKNLYK